MTQAQKAKTGDPTGLVAVFAGLLILLYAAYALFFFVAPWVTGGAGGGAEFFAILPIFAAMQTAAVATRRAGRRPQGRALWHLAGLCALAATVIFAIALSFMLWLVFGNDAGIKPRGSDTGILLGLALALGLFHLMIILAGLWFGGRAAERRLARIQPNSDQGDQP